MNYSNIQSDSNIYFYIIVLILLCVSHLNFSIIQMNNFRWFERASFKVLFCHYLLLKLFMYCKWSVQVNIQGNKLLKFYLISDNSSFNSFHFNITFYVKLILNFFFLYQNKLTRSFQCGYSWLSMWVNVIKGSRHIKLVTKKVAALSKWFGRQLQTFQGGYETAADLSMWLQNGTDLSCCFQ